MTSGTFTSKALDEIYTEDRQRKDLGNIKELEESIAAIGLINPIVVTREGRLVAGERRLTACRNIGWTAIPVQFAEDLEPLQLHLIELEENIKRKALTWQEHTKAVAQFHEVKTATSEEPWTAAKTARSLGITEASAGQHLSVAKEMSDATISDADKFSVALGIVKRRNERKGTIALGALQNTIAENIPPVSLDTPNTPSLPKREKYKNSFSLLNVDFTEWTETYDGPKFNLVHCDFPYGVGMHKSEQGAAASFGGYLDTEDTYFKLLDHLLSTQEQFIEESAHMMFWFSMDYYQTTLEMLTAEGWVVNPFPLVWGKSDNKGILPDTNRGPRRIYETAFLCTRGDRKVVRPVANLIYTPTTKVYHMNEKPEMMLTHFFRMLIDSSTRMLDPTCGSGNSVKTSMLSGAAFSLGLEINPDFHSLASQNMQT